MPILLQQHNDNCQWAIWHIEEPEEQLCSLFPHPANFDSQLEHFSAPQRRSEWIAVRALLYSMLNKSVTILYDEKGRPSLADNSFHISISHTKGYAAILLSRNYEVGIDIEQVGRRVEKVATHFMHPDEHANRYMGDIIWSLLLHWSAKEAIYKCLNLLDVDFVQHLRILPFEVKAEGGTFNAVEYRSPFQHKYIVHYLLHPDFVFTYTLSIPT